MFYSYRFNPSIALLKPFLMISRQAVDLLWIADFTTFLFYSWSFMNSSRSKVLVDRNDCLLVKVTTLSSSRSTVWCLTSRITGRKD